MKRREMLAAVIAMVVVCTSTSLWAAPIITLQIGTESSGPLPFFVEDGVYVIGSQGSNGQTFTAEGADGGSIHVSGVLDEDPEIIFSSAATDLGAPSNFGYSFILPLVPQLTNPTTVQDSFAGGVTNGAGSGGVTVTALAPGALPVDTDGIPELMTYWVSDDNMGTWQNVDLDLGPSDTVAANSAVSTPWGVFNEGPIPTVFGGPWTHMRVDLNFGLSGGGDIFNFTGSALLVPEPGTFMLALLGIAAACGFGRRGAR